MSKKRTNRTNKFEHELTVIHPRNQRQKEALDSLFNNTLTILTGAPGTAKTFLSVYAAYRLLEHREIDQIYYVKPAVDIVGERGHGFRKGDDMDKFRPHLAPVLDSLLTFMPKGKANYIIDNGVVEFLPLEDLLGRSLANAFVIADEMQNATTKSVFTVLTRLAQNSRMALLGDTAQRHLDTHYGISGLADAVHRLRGLPGSKHIEFSVEDIVRHRFVRDVIYRYLDYYEAV